MAKILVIDDDSTITMMVETVLENNNYTASTATCGTAGLEKARTEHPDLIILDRQMPEMDGNQVLIDLKSNETTKNIPVIMLTGDDRMEDISTSLSLGAADYIVKPFDIDNFLIRLERTLQK